MNFLELCQRTARECGVTSARNVPLTVVNQEGQLGRVIEWVGSAWGDIQNRHPNWLWMRSRFSFDTAVGVASYGAATDTRLSAPARLGRWIVLDDNGVTNVLIHLQSAGVAGQRRLAYLPWANFQSIYGIGLQTNRPPVHCTIDPQNRLTLGPAPDAVYVVSGEYQMAPQVLAANNDVPELAERHRLLIVYRAMQAYSQHYVASEIFTSGVRSANRLMRQLEQEQLPAVSLARPLA